MLFCKSSTVMLGNDRADLQSFLRCRHDNLLVVSFIRMLAAGFADLQARPVIYRAPPTYGGQCIAGICRYESGTVTVDGRPLAPRDRSSFLFYTPDAIAPWPAQTVNWVAGNRHPADFSVSMT